MFPAQVAHSVPGRIRVKLPSARRNTRALEELRSALIAMPHVRAVEINAITGSLTIHHHPGRAGFEQQLRNYAEQRQLFELRPRETGRSEQFGQIMRGPSQTFPESSKSADAIIGMFRSLDQTVKCATDNTLDLKVLLPAGVLLYTFLAAELMAGTPLWVTISFFSFSSFVALHPFPGPANPSESRLAPASAHPQRPTPGEQG
jgi:hypothetical protein